MKKKQKLFLGVFITVIIVLGAIGGVIIYSNQGVKQAVTPTSFTPVFCNDYEFTCCIDKADPISYTFSSKTDSYLCNSNYCKLTYVKGPSTIGGYVDYLYAGTQSCQSKYDLFTCGGTCFECSDKTTVRAVSQINKGTYLYTLGQNTLINLENHNNRLDFCGRSGCPQGVPVSGADGCKFNPPGGSLYTSTSSLTGKVQASSYVVPTSQCVLAWQSGDRHICGYKEESCSSDSDCTGYNYGNKQCNARNLQTYGCTSYGNVITSTDRGPFSSGWGTDVSQPTQSGTANYGKKCGIISAVNVQCCGDTDCGSNMFCDTNSFTCKPNVGCTSDSQCGVSQQCDFINKKLKTPKCSSGQCTYNEVNVDCCSSSDCADGYYCTNDKKCEKSIASCTQCTYDCCQGECTATGGLLDKPCGSTNPLCVSHKCQAEDYCVTHPTDPGCQAKSCSWYQTLNTNKDYGFLWWRAFINSPIITQSCVLAWWISVLVALVFIIVIGYFIITILKLLNKRKR